MDEYLHTSQRKHLSKRGPRWYIPWFLEMGSGSITHNWNIKFFNIFLKKDIWFDLGILSLRHHIHPWGNMFMYYNEIWLVCGREFFPINIMDIGLYITWMGPLKASLLQEDTAVLASFSFLPYIYCRCWTLVYIFPRSAVNLQTDTATLIVNLDIYVPHQQCLSSSFPGLNGPHFAGNIFKCIFLNEKVWFLTKISLKFLPEGSLGNNPALVQMMAWHWIGDKP